jgi:hypothetical protein
MTVAEKLFAFDKEGKVLYERIKERRDTDEDID